ncbi:MAG: RNA polymerase sigma factor [Anaerolineae bacterium]
MDESEQKQIFSAWLDQHKGIFFKIVRAYAFNLHDQDDLFQEISLQVWKSIPDFRGDSKPSTWIYRVALFTASTWVRQEKKRPSDQPLADVEHTLTMADSGVQDSRLDWLYEQIGQLDPIDRSICLLMLDGFSYKEIASLVGISDSNVGVKIHRIKQTLSARKPHAAQENN